jgi:hypothetical protein
MHYALLLLQPKVDGQYEPHLHLTSILNGWFPFGHDADHALALLGKGGTLLDNALTLFGSQLA